MGYAALQDREFFKRSDFAVGFPERISGVERWRFLADRFDSFLSNGKASPPISIPKIIHQVWLGSELPRAYVEWTKGWKRINHGWDWRLWDEKALLGLGLLNENAFRKSRSKAAKSDIARYELLYRFGGIYADTDFECLRPFDVLANRCTFFVGTIFADSPELNNALIGSIPGHPLMKDLVKKLHDPVLTKGAMEVIAQSGAYFLTERFFASQRLLGEHDVVFPSTYFYPLPNFAPVRRLSEETRKQYLRDWSFAVHYWEGSWMKPHPARVFLSRMKKRLLSLIRSSSPGPA
jgi:inositol phosphorylceramide mannosyltransferase catalytic subunit